VVRPEARAAASAADPARPRSRVRKAIEPLPRRRAPHPSFRAGSTVGVSSNAAKSSLSEDGAALLSKGSRGANGSKGASGSAASFWGAGANGASGSKGSRAGAGAAVPPPSKGANGSSVALGSKLSAPPGGASGSRGAREAGAPPSAGGNSVAPGSKGSPPTGASSPSFGSGGPASGASGGTVPSLSIARYRRSAALAPHSSHTVSMSAPGP
jgi:hypothetical protein